MRMSSEKESGQRTIPRYHSPAFARSESCTRWNTRWGTLNESPPPCRRAPEICLCCTKARFQTLVHEKREDIARNAQPNNSRPIAQRQPPPLTGAVDDGAKHIIVVFLGRQVYIGYDGGHLKDTGSNRRQNATSECIAGTAHLAALRNLIYSIAVLLQRN